MVDVYVIDACRTPVGKYRGGLAAIRPDDLLAGVLAALIDRNPTVPVEEIEDVVIGAANQAGEDNRNVARMGALLAGLPLQIGGATVNRLCGSGLEAINAGWAALAAGNGDLVIAGGVESMSRAPFLLPRLDEGLPRDYPLIDTKLGWRLVNPRMPTEWVMSMGRTAELLAGELDISRDEQDAFALGSHAKAVAAQDGGRFSAELVPVQCPTTGECILDRDEGPRPDTTAASLAQLRPAFLEGGTVTAGNSSPLNDGAAAVLLATERAVSRYGLEPMARLVRYAVAGVEPNRMGIGPVPALRKALDRAGWTLQDLEVVELNEAFAAQALAVLRTLALDEARVNPLGGAIALGHPLGCSGARLLTTLVHYLRSDPAVERGAVTMCIGVGQGIATLVERIK